MVNGNNRKPGHRGHGSVVSQRQVAKTEVDRKVGLQLDLQFRQSLGIGNQVRNNIILLGENSLIFSAGIKVCM
jgi:hypothetical protein